MAFAANTYEIQLVVSKYVFGPAENVSITGYVRNISSNETTNTTTLVVGGNVSVSVLNSTNGSVSSYLFTTGENGTFYSLSSFHPNSTQILSPNISGTYAIFANYTQNNTDWTARANIVVVSTNIDDIEFQLPKVNFYAGENMVVTVKTVQKVGGSLVAIANVSLNISMRHANETIISSFNCTTGAAGTCNITTTAPSSAGTYMLEANNFVGFTNFKVVPFDVEAYMKDSSALTFKNIFSKSETGFVEVRVSYNSTTPGGTYNATGTIVNASGDVVQNLSSIILNATNGFVDKLPFTVTSTMPVGFYTVNVSVIQSGGSEANTTSNFQVRDWSLTFTKAAKNSGFEYGYTAFAGTRVFFEAYPVNRSNGTVIENLTNNFTIELKNTLGAVLSNATASYNASCGGKPCYEFNITMPSTVGDYTLSVALNYSDDYQALERTLKATDITATAEPSDSEGLLKELFGTNEFVYIKLSTKNQTTNITASSAEIADIIYENGTKLSYSQGNITNMNLSDSTLQWAYNATSGRLIIDPPKTGGGYLIEVYVNNKSAAVTTRIGINPYDVCTSAKGSADTSTSDYWYQFRTSDTIYFHIKISEAQNTAGRALSNASGHNGTYGRGSQCSFDSTTKRSINNATITIEKVLNAQGGKTETLNTTSSTCTATDTTGGYICTVQASDNRWDGGRHIVTFNVLGDDNITSAKAAGFFEARAFYIYGYSSNWANKATSNITLNLNVYEAGSGWWNSGSGLSGTAAVDSINYYGGVGEWIWPPIKYDYNVTGLNITITGGSGTVTLPANRSSKVRWDGGYFSAVVKVTVNDQIDYGEAWFSIRNWDLYATPVEVRGNSFDTKYSVNSRQNATLYVKIGEAGDYSDFSGGRPIGGNVAISVKKILDYSQWPPIEMASTNFTSNTITVNASSPWYSSANVDTHGKYLLNISPRSGRWESGYYSVIIDINGTENGYGWFNVISFYINTQPTNANGTGYVYNNKGNGPVYFNITTTKSQKSFYSSGDYVNATITDLVLRSWDSSTQSQRELTYPAQLNISQLLVNGSAVVAINYTNGTWPSGYYYGEIKMRDTSDDSTAKGSLWFSIQPFRVSSTTSSYNVGTKENVTVNISIYEPDWSSSTLLNANYTVVSVKETSWNNGAYRITNLNYSYTNASGVFRNNTLLAINPSNGKWTPGYKSGIILVKDNATNSTQETWFSFRATSFTDTVTRLSSQNVGSADNVTVNITLTTPAGAKGAGNLSSAFYWGYPSKIRYRFVIGSCDSATSTRCFINGSANVTVLPPSGGWREGYNYLYFEYVEPDDSSALTESYNSVYFYVRQPISGYMYAVGSNGYSQYDFGQTENVTMYISSMQNLSGNNVAANVTNVQIAKTNSGCWSESCRSYQNATWQVVLNNSGGFTNAPGTGINGSGYIRINASGGTWETDDYAVKVFVTQTGTSNTGVIKDATFRVKDKKGPVINITSPTREQAINASSFWINATTSEGAVCYINLMDYGTYDRNNCGINGTNSTNSTNSACNTTRYNNATTFYFSTISKWYTPSGNQLYTDSTTHYYNHTTGNMPVPQNYTVRLDCYDEDWNYATNATTFYLTGRGNQTNGTSGGGGNGSSNTTLNITIHLPANTTYNTPNLSLNYTINQTASACWYFLNNRGNASLPNCANTTFTADLGYNNITVYANNSRGTFNSSTVYFTTTTSANITISQPENITYNYTNQTLVFTLANGSSASACWYKLNVGSNTSIASCMSTTFLAAEGYNNITVYANLSNGTIFGSDTRYFTANSTIVINISLPANTTHSTTALRLNYTLSGAASSCWYRLNNNSNASLPGCTNTTFNGTEGYNNITAFANNSTGGVFSSGTRFFTVNTTAGASITITVTSPANTTYNTSNTTLNYTVNGTASACWYRLNTGGNTTLPNCAAITFSNTAQGDNNITVYANNSTGSSFNSSTVFFSIDTIAPSINYSSSTVNNATVTFNFTMINATLSEVPAAVLLEFNGANYTMLNTSSLAWYRNHTVNASGNYTFKTYANDTVGNIGVTSLRWVYFNLT